MKWLIVTTMVATVLASGCANRGNEGSPVPGATATAGASNGAASPGASPNTGGTGAGGGGTVTSPSPGVTPSATPTIAPEKLPTLTSAQNEKLDINSTYEDLVKTVGGDLKPTKEENGKKTYELRVSDVPNTFVEITYFSDGKMSTKSVYLR